MNKKVTKKEGPNDSIIMHADKPKYSLIWLHGLGDDASGFQDFFQSADSPLYKSARIILMTAPKRAVTVNGGYKTNSWYDFKTFDRQSLMTRSDEDCYSMKQLQESCNMIEKVVQTEVENWTKEFPNSKINPYHRIFIGGFSQGCATTLYYTLTCQNPIAAIIGYSGHFFKSCNLKNLGKTRILLFHGKKDPLLNEQMCKLSYNPILKDSTVTYVPVAGLAHSVQIWQLVQTTKFICEVAKQVLSQV